MLKNPNAQPGGQFFKPTLSANDTSPRVTAVSANSDRIVGGLSVTITGANFRYNSDGSAPIVLFGATPATAVVVVSPTVITCTTPAVTASAVVNITVTSGSQSGILYGGFTYYAGVISALSPGYGALAGGITVLIQGYNFLTGSTIKFGGSAATSVVFIDSEHFSCVTPNHSVGYVDVVITEPLGGQVTLRNGFQYTLFTRGQDIRRMPGISIRDVNNGANTCTFRLDGRSNAPVCGEKIEILDGADLKFAGVVQSFEQVFEELTDQLAWDVTCVDFTGLLNRRRPFGSFSGVSASDVVRWLVSNYAPGFTAVHVQSNLAKVTVTFDGSQDFVTCLNIIAGAIGGGHWYVDYTQDMHFFHIVPVSVVPPAQMGVATAHMTVVEAGGIPSTFTYDNGYMFWRHTFVYSDGTESSYQAISNVLRVSGTKMLSFTGIPTGANPAPLTCVARRLYYNKFVARADAYGESIEVVHGFVQVNDNTTTAFTTWFGTTGASDPIVIAIPAGKPLPEKKYNGHPAGPATGPSVSADLLPAPSGNMGGYYQFKVACLYRDGTVSYPSPASNTIRQKLTNGILMKGFNLTNIPTGQDVNGLDCVARFVYYCLGDSYTPEGVIIPYPTPLGYVDQSVYNEPNWAQHVGGIIMVPENTSTTVPPFSLRWLDAPLPVENAAFYSIMYPGAVVGFGNLPYGNGNQPVSVDPVPVWPNPDGPSLENTVPPADINALNLDLLRDPAFKMSVDNSQTRNRVMVFGSGSTVTVPAAIGAAAVYVSDISNFSPAGGRVKIVDPIANTTQFVQYSGIEGMLGKAAITIIGTLTKAVADGSSVVNFFQADDVASQKALAKVEVDVNGNPTDGIHEYVVYDTSLKAAFQLYMRAYAELELYSRPIVRITYSTRGSCTAGQTVHVDLTSPPCVGDFLIQEVVIDQFHDESDDLSPRYNVTASSVRFELNDLLLQLLGTSSGGATSMGGFVASATAAAASTSAGVPQATTRIPYWTVLAPTSFGVATAPTKSDQTWTSTVAVSGTGSGQAGVTDAAGYWDRITAGTDSGQEARLETPGNLPFAYISHNPTMIWNMRTGPVITGYRLHIGLLDAIAHWPNSDTTAIAGVGVRYSSAVDGGGWVPYYSDGVTRTIGAPITAINPSTVYVIKISLLVGGTATISINGSTVSFTIPAIPPTLGLKGEARLFPNLTTHPGLTKAFDWKSVYGEHD